jgi:S1-C subfamily serine protease
VGPFSESGPGLEARRSLWGWAVLVLGLSLLVGGVAGGVAGALTASLLSDDEEQVVAPIPTPAPGGVILQSEESAITEAVQKALPAVVAVINKEVTSTGQSGQPLAMGSGVIIDERGYIVTNEHVVHEVGVITVLLTDGRETEAELVGQDWPFMDVAVLKIDGEELAPIALGDSDSLVPGQRVIAVGNSLEDFRSSVTVGVVSGVGRRWQRDGIFLEGLIQTDAAINPGNSGGALIDSLGRLVGMPTSVVRSDNGRTVEGVAFAIPSKVIQDVASQIIENGSTRRAYLGVSHIDVTPEVAAARGLAVDRGAWVSSVGEGTPAEKAGIEVGDVILRMGDLDITTDLPFLNVLMRLEPDETVPTLINRDGNEITLQVRPIQRPLRS